jgi:hypothetical protein
MMQSNFYRFTWFYQTDGWLDLCETENLEIRTQNFECRNDRPAYRYIWRIIDLRIVSISSLGGNELIMNVSQAVGVALHNLD